jgi:Na+-transporting NADH:ubiquinone oxidoreductase subunit C
MAGITQNRYWAVVFMFVLTAILSTILIGLARFTEPRVRLNREIAFETAAVRCIPLIEAKTETEIHTVFGRDFIKPESASGAYLYQPSGRAVGYALPFSGQGFWSTIRGVIGISVDRKTILGVWFYEQAETPGLGARIVEPFFYEQFAGKIFSSDARPIRIKSVADATDKDIAAISGATQTCVRLEKLLNAAIEEWRNKMTQEGSGQ